MKTVILCGGKGTRLKEHTEEIPKPLVEIGDKPILWHIMKIYSFYGYREFILCLGYKGEKIEEYFINADKKNIVSIQTLEGVSSDKILYLEDGAESWEIILAYTGRETNTGGRIKRIEKYIEEDNVFFATYGDGVADIQLNLLYEFHKKHGKLATLTCVNPMSQFGILHTDGGGLITKFEEKPRLDHWVNGGFFVFNKKVFAYLDENSVLEKKPFNKLVQNKGLIAYRHSGFWACMDTYKDTVMLNELWKSGKAKWKIWR